MQGSKWQKSRIYTSATIQGRNPISNIRVELNDVRKVRMSGREQDRNKFTRLAEARVTRALNDIRLIGNLSDRTNYEYDDNDVARIFRALGDELSACRKRFEAAKRKRAGVKFRLGQGAEQ